MSRAHIRYAYLATLADWSEIENLLRSSTAKSATELKHDMDMLVDRRLTEASDEQWATIIALADVDAEFEVGKLKMDAFRYRWLCGNNFDRQRTQVHTWVHTWEPHSVTGEPIEWKARVRGGALDAIIDAEIAKEPR